MEDIYKKILKCAEKAGIAISFEDSEIIFDVESLSAIEIKSLNASLSRILKTGKFLKKKGKLVLKDFKQPPLKPGLKSTLKSDLPKIIIYQFGRGVAYPNRKGFKNYPIHSRGAKPWKELSPFLIGPVEFTNSDGILDSCPIFENYWQAQKVYKTVSKQNQKKPGWIWPSEKHIGKDGEPNKLWYEWKDALCHTKTL